MYTGNRNLLYVIIFKPPLQKKGVKVGSHTVSDKVKKVEEIYIYSAGAFASCASWCSEKTNENFIENKYFKGM